MYNSKLRNWIDCNFSQKHVHYSEIEERWRERVDKLSAAFPSGVKKSNSTKYAAFTINIVIPVIK
jgi:hypothetical protein